MILEITETIAMEGAETTIEILTRLKSLGVLLAIDSIVQAIIALGHALGLKIIAEGVQNTDQVEQLYYGKNADAVRRAEN